MPAPEAYDRVRRGRVDARASSTYCVVESHNNHCWGVEGSADERVP